MDSLFTNPELVQAEVARLMQTGEGLLAGTAGSLSYIPYATQVSEDRLEETVSTVARTISGSTSAHYCEQGERVIRLLRDISAPAIELIAMPCNFNVAKSNDDQSRVIAGPPEGYNDCFSLLVIPVYPMSRGSTHTQKHPLGRIGGRQHRRSTCHCSLIPQKWMSWQLASRPRTELSRHPTWQAGSGAACHPL